MFYEEPTSYQSSTTYNMSSNVLPRNQCVAKVKTLLKQWQSRPTIPASDSIFSCTVCEVGYTTPEEWHVHMDSSDHQSQMRFINMSYCWNCKAFEVEGTCHVVRRLCFKQLNSELIRYHFDHPERCTTYREDLDCCDCLIEYSGGRILVPLYYGRSLHCALFAEAHPPRPYESGYFDCDGSEYAKGLLTDTLTYCEIDTFRAMVYWFQHYDDLSTKYTRLRRRNEELVEKLCVEKDFRDEQYEILTELMSEVFDHKDTIPNGLFLTMNNKMKELYECL